MIGRRIVLRVAGALISEACQRLPAAARQDREREWAAELAVIVDDPDIRSRWRRYLRALRFAAAQGRTVRRLIRLTGAQRVRAVVVRAAVAAAAAAVVLALAAVAFGPVADNSSSDSSPAALAEILLITLAFGAALLCALLIAGLGLAKSARALRPRAAARAAGGGTRFGRMPRTARGARVALVAGVVAYGCGAVAGTLSAAGHGSAGVSSALGVAASLLAITGTACLGAAAILAVAATGGRLRRLARHERDTRR